MRKFPAIRYMIILRAYRAAEGGERASNTHTAEETRKGTQIKHEVAILQSYSWVKLLEC